MAPAPINQVPNDKQMEEVYDDIDSVNDIKAKLKEKISGKLSVRLREGQV